MCIAVIKRSTNQDYSFFIAFNRDEAIAKKWIPWDYHWKHFPNVFGFLDVDTGGTWLARNDDGVVAFLINRESENKQSLNSRAYVVLNVLSKAKTALETRKYVNNSNIREIKPFNFIAVDKANVVYWSNICNKGMQTILYENLIMINRSFPNDFKEIRINNNYLKFKFIKEPDPERNNYSCWERILKECSFTDGVNTEFTMSLISENWKTLSSSIIAIRRDGNLPVIKEL